MSLQEKLAGAHDLSAGDLMKLDHEYGHHIGHSLNKFHAECDEMPQLIGSHGHTVFHQPVDGRFSLQIGHGAQIASLTGIDTVTDFRNTDISLGGQGAPLVPVGDRDLFSDHSACLNLGGIANISIRKGKRMEAFDICPANMALNDLMSETGTPFDRDGEMAAEGKIDHSLLEILEKLEFYSIRGPRSLGREWYSSVFRPVLRSADSSISDKLATVCEHIAMRITDCLPADAEDDLLITGGGAHNKHLVMRICHHLEKKGRRIHLPERAITDFKEAIIFGYLALLRSMGRTNTLASVTGASRDSSGGCIYKGLTA
jgi:anhydro-N-acetylmuramic acid kinase